MTLRIFVLDLCLCLAGCVTIPQQPLTTGLRYSSRALDPAQITVLSWNIEKGRAHHWQEALDTGKLAARIQASDLLLLQEACVKPPNQLPGLEQFLARGGYAWQLAISFDSNVFGCGDGQATGVLIASRVAPIQVLALRSKHKEFGLTPKTSLAMLFPLASTDETLLVINTHLLNFQLFSSDDFTAQLTQLIDLIAQHPGPVLFAGDLNTRNQARLDILKKMMLHYCLETLLPLPPDPRTTDRIHHAYVLDHILFRGLRPLTPLRVGTEQSEKTSDHKSIGAVFALSPQPACPAHS